MEASVSSNSVNIGSRTGDLAVDVLAHVANAANSSASAVVAATNKTAADLANDNSFGPQLGSKFDFTLLFEHAILTLVPTVLLIAACPFYVCFKRNDKIQVKRGKLFWGKVGTALLLFIVQVVQLALWSSIHQDDSRSHWAIASSSVSCLAALCIGLMINSEHRRAIQPSTVLSIYFAISVAVDIAKARSYFLRVGLDAVGALQIVVTIAKASLLLLEEMPKTSLLKDTALRDYLGKEALSGFWNRSLGIWMYETFSSGFRNILSIDDLGNLSPEFFTSTLSERFESAWAATDHSKRLCLAIATFKVCYKPFLLAIIPKALFSVCALSQPFLIHSAIGIIDKQTTSRADQVGLILATVLVYGGMAVFRSIYTSFKNRTTTLMRGVLTGKVCSKAYQLPTDQASKGAALTHSTTDIQGVLLGVNLFHELWIGFIEIGFIMYFLWIFVGYACFLILIPTFVSVFWAMYFGPIVGASLQRWNKKIEDRVGKTTQILAQAKQVKTLGFQSTLADYIQQLRTKELRVFQRYRATQSLIVLMAMANSNLTTVLIIAGALFITKIPLPLDANRIFATLAVVQLAMEPLMYIVTGYTNMSTMLASFDRIRDFLLLPERTDGRTTVRPSRSNVPSSLELDIDDEAFASRPIDVVDALLGPEGSLSPILHYVDVTIPRGYLAIAKGPNGSGKTTFLKNLIGEGSIYKGALYVREGPIAYCDQTSWLRNGTVRDNILGYLPYNSQWYETVLQYCCLEDDLKQMADGDRSEVGNQGSKLSGGQRHRIALARAIYSRASVLILDDIFSALDGPTSRQVFTGLFNRGGLLRRLGTTVVLATHNTEFHVAADVLLEFDHARHVVMKKGKRGDVDGRIQHAAGVSDGPVREDRLELAPAAMAMEAMKKKSSIYHKSDFTIYKFFFSTGSGWLFLLLTLATLITTLGERAPGIFMRFWLSHNPNSRTLYAGYAVLGITPLLGYIGMAVIFFHHLVPQYASNMHQMLVNTMFSATVPYLTATDHGLLINRISQHMTIITEQFARDFFKLPYSFFNVVADVAIIISASYYAVALLPVICVILYVIQMVYLRTSRQLRLLDLEAMTPMYSLLAEVGSGVNHMRAFGWWDNYLKRTHCILDVSQKPFYFMACVQRWLMFIMDSLNTCIALVLMCFAVFWGSTTSQTGLGLSFVTLIGLANCITFFMNQWIAIETSLGAIDGIRSFVRDTPVEKEGDASHMPEDWPQSGEIKLENVTAFYKMEEKSTPALKDITVTLATKESAVISGRTGSGKSSLFLTLLNCLSYQGSIQIDGQELRDIPLTRLRSIISLCPQDNLKLPGNIRQNLMPWALNDPSQEKSYDGKLEEILKNLDLWTVIDEAGGLDGPMEELGLSSGQDQLFSLARTMITKIHRSSRIILMDEITGHLDEVKEEEILQTISETFADCTVLTIAHRPGTIAAANKVYEMQNGGMVLKADRRPSGPLPQASSKEQ